MVEPVEEPGVGGLQAKPAMVGLGMGVGQIGVEFCHERGMPMRNAAATRHARRVRPRRCAHGSGRPKRTTATNTTSQARVGGAGSDAVGGNGSWRARLGLSAQCWCAPWPLQTPRWTRRAHVHLAFNAFGILETGWRRCHPG